MSRSIAARRLTVIQPVPAVRSVSVLARAAAATAAAYLALLVCAAVPTGVGMLLAVLAVAACEALVTGRDRFLGWGLSRATLDVAARGLVRALALVLFAARATSGSLTIAVALVLAGIAILRVANEAAAQAVVYLRTPDMASRGLELELPTLPAAPPRWAMRPDRWTAVVEVVATVGLVWADRGSDAAAAVLLGVAVLPAVTAPVVLAGHVARLYRLRVKQRVRDAVMDALTRLRPEVITYLGNGADWRYQLEMWLRPLEVVTRPVVLIVRDYEVLQLLAPTTLPVVCIPRGARLMEMPLPTARAALYVGNTASNIHLLRRPELRSVFIGHGDSDKGASANPFSRVYQEIWVAGPAARERYRAAGVDIPDSSFVEVGRPQLGDLPREPDEDPRPTVLYAPTFEGFGEDPFQSSVPYAGVEIVRQLLARGDVRVMYRPHPRTGHRDPATRAAHLEIIDMLRRAGALRPEDIPVGAPPALAARAHADLLDELAVRDSASSLAEHEALVRQWAAAYWAASPGHRILTPPAPDLHSCFTMTDALIADISSVTSDFLAADRPYAVVNCTGRPDAEFQARSRSAAGGFILGAGLGAMDPLIRAARGGEDPTAAVRSLARVELLGPRTADPTERFRREIDRICTSPRVGTPAVDV
jgi:hypothetical protein